MRDDKDEVGGKLLMGSTEPMGAFSPEGRSLAPREGANAPHGFFLRVRGRSDRLLLVRVSKLDGFRYNHRKSETPMFQLLLNRVFALAPAVEKLCPEDAQLRLL